MKIHVCDQVDFNELYCKTWPPICMMRPIWYLKIHRYDSKLKKAHFSLEQFPRRDAFVIPTMLPGRNNRIHDYIHLQHEKSVSASDNFTRRMSTTTVFFLLMTVSLAMSWYVKYAIIQACGLCCRNVLRQ